MLTWSTSTPLKFPLFNEHPLTRRVSCSSASCNSHSTSTLQDSCNKKNMKTLYDILHVNYNASLKEIKTAYRTLAKMYHPDIVLHSKKGHADDEQEFIRICNAYATLSDPMARALYDMSFGGRERELGTSGGSMLRHPRHARQGGSSFYQTRRWETDQCW